MTPFPLLRIRWFADPLLLPSATASAVIAPEAGFLVGRDRAGLDIREHREEGYLA